MVPVGTSTKHLKHVDLWLDFQNRRGIAIEGKDCVFTLTTMQDLANVVVRAIEYEGEWPVVGGVQGTTITDSKLIDIGVKVRGMFKICENKRVFEE